MAYDDLKDADYAETRVKNSGKSKGRKGNVAPKTYTVPDLIVEGDYSNVTIPKDSNSGGPGTAGRGGWKPRPESATQSPEGQNVKYQAPRGGGSPSVSELPGQYTGVPKSGGR